MVSSRLAGLVLDVGEVQSDEFGTAHRRSEPDPDHRGVADTDGRAAIDTADDLSDLLNRQRPCESAWCGAVGPAESAPGLPHGLGGDRVGEAAGAVDVPNDGTGHVQRARRAAGFAALGEVGAQREWVGRQCRDPATGAPAFPLCPDHRVEPPGGLGPEGRDGGADASDVNVSQPGGQQIEVGGRRDGGGGREGGDHQVRHGAVVPASPPPPPDRVAPHRRPSPGEVT